MVRSDISKSHETLQDCLQYKAFLDALTPPEHFEKARADKRARQEARRQRRELKEKRALESGSSHEPTPTRPPPPLPADDCEEGGCPGKAFEAPVSPLPASLPPPPLRGSTIVRGV